MVNVGTIGHIDHGKKIMIVGHGSSLGTYGAMIKSISEEDCKAIIDFKTENHIFIDNLSMVVEPRLPNNKQSWQALNRGNFNKKQRRVKF